MSQETMNATLCSYLGEHNVLHVNGERGRKYISFRLLRIIEQAGRDGAQSGIPSLWQDEKKCPDGRWLSHRFLTYSPVLECCHVGGVDS
jgi:hypothetical protein